MVSIFKDGIETYVNALLTQNKPKTVAVCCIYFPDEAAQEGSAILNECFRFRIRKVQDGVNAHCRFSDTTMTLHRCPVTFFKTISFLTQKVQTLIESVYRHAIQKISIPGYFLFSV